MWFVIVLIILVQIKNSTQQNEHILKIGFYKNITSKSCGLKSFRSIPQLPPKNNCFKWHKTIVEQMQYKMVNSIKDGRFAIEGEVPYTVYLSPSKGRCTGSIISEFWVLTAAHCIDKTDLTKETLVIYSGLNVFQYPRDKKRLIKAEKVIFHPRYNEDGLGKADHDIGLIKLEKKIVPNNDIPDANSVCLPGNILPDTYQITKSSYAILSGWGYVDDERANEERLKVILVPINRYLGGLIIATRISFGHACRGDSGGPLVQYVNGRAVIIGVMAQITRPKSDKDKMCGNVRGMKFASVTYDVDWIRDTINKNS